MNVSAPARPLTAQVPARLAARRLPEPDARPTQSRLQTRQELQLPGVLHMGI